MSNNDRRRIVEDKPEMRSMQIMSAAPVPLMMPRATPIAKAPLAKPQRHEPASSGWSVISLEPLPPIYCLERTHLHVNGSVDIVADRISECLRKESMLAVFSKEENVVDVETEDHVQFSIRLWKGKNGQVLVEVQKSAGCCYSYCQAAKAVLRAAKGIQTPAKRRTFSIPPCVPRISAEESEAATKDGLEVAEQLLKKQQLDAHALAIESLMHLSRASENQCFTARCILSGEFRGKLLSLVESWDGQQYNEVEKEHYAVMRRHSFCILANCLSALERSGELASMLLQQQELTSTGFVESLVEEVAAAEKRPHDACQAANCLRTLVAASEDMKRKAAELNAFETISEARMTGACRHAALEDACTQLRTLL